MKRSGNPFAKNYRHSPGYPAFAPRARHLGELTGTWCELGRQIGTGAGDLVRCVSDVWWQEHVEKWGERETREALTRYEEQIEALSPDLIGFMRGLAEGAGPELDRSPFAGDSSHYEKILNTNIFDAWSWRHPGNPSGQTSERSGENGCSSFATLGSGPNRSAAMIAAHNRHCPFDPKCYQIVYTARPEGGNAFWCLTAGAAGSGCQIANDKGVSIILNAGGNQHAETGANAFGVPWFLLFLYVAAHADSAAQAIELISQGTPGYRANTGRNSLLRTGTWNFLVADRSELAVLETSCDRYAVRRPGDLGEVGDYLVMTNHNTCDYSFDQDNRRTDVPMTRFGDESTSPGSAKRFWTLMWDIRNHYGEIDRDLAMRLLRGHHQYDRDGNRVEAGPGEAPLQFGGDVTCPHSGGYPEKWLGGTADAKIAVLEDDPTVYWTLGRPCEWEGPWDEAVLASG